MSMNTQDETVEVETETWDDNPFQGLTVTKESVDAVREVRTATKKRNNGVCICGHPQGAHTDYVEAGTHPSHDAHRDRGESRCIPSRVKCECAAYEQVLTAQDLRQFRHSTQGPGGQHALALGIHSSVEKGKGVKWEPGVSCVVCKLARGMVPLTPVAYIRTSMQEARRTTDLNVLICENCRSKVVAQKGATQ